jgi:hypothetical protein
MTAASCEYLEIEEGTRQVDGGRGETNGIRTAIESGNPRRCGDRHDSGGEVPHVIQAAAARGAKTGASDEDARLNKLAKLVKKYVAAKKQAGRRRKAK